MNELQASYTRTDNSLGYLLVQIDTFYQELPDPVRKAFDALGSTAKWGCHCDIEEGMEPDGCVLDEGTPQNCVYARTAGIKAKCEYWRPVEFKRRF